MPFRRPKKTGPWFTDIRPRIAGRPTGERIRLLMPNVTTRPEAIKEENRIAQELREGTRSAGFTDFVRKQYLPWADLNLKSPLTTHTHAEALIEFFGNRQLSEISLFNIEQYKRERVKSKTIRGGYRKPGTINNELFTLSKILGKAVAGGIIRVNPMAEVETLEQDSWRTRSLSSEEEAELFKHLDSPEYLKPIVKLALLTGMRQGEILNLQWEHLRLDRSLLYVVRPKWKDDPRKTEGMPIVDEARQLLESLPRRSPYCFPSRANKKVRAACLQKAFQRACDDAELTDFCFHDLRHTFGSRMARSNIKLQRLQRLMGHSDPRMTMRYIHVDEGDLREALRQAAPLLTGISHIQDTGKIMVAR